MGRGTGSGRGKTSGKGHKGQKARTGNQDRYKDVDNVLTTDIDFESEVIQRCKRFSTLPFGFMV